MAFWNRKSQPVELPNKLDVDYAQDFAAFSNMMQGAQKSFDWNHYQAVADGGNQMFGSEFNVVPTIRITKNMFIQEPWINACTSAIFRQFLGSKLILKMKSTSDGQEQKLAKHAILEYMNAPGSLNESLGFFLSNIVADLVLTGNAYWWSAKDLTDKKRIPAEKIEPIIVNNKVTHYRLTGSISGGLAGAVELLPEEITHVKLPNPFSSHIGLSMIIATVLPVLIDKYGREYVVAFFLRGGTTAGIIQTKTTNMDQLLKLARTLMQAFGGRKNMHADKILPEGAEWKGGGSNFSEMRLIELLKDNVGHFRAATGCTNSVLGIADNINRATAFAEMEQFYRSTIMPLQKMICDSIKGSSIWKRFGLDDNWTIAFDNSDVIYLDDFERKVDQDAKLAGTWTINERRERLGKKSLGGDYDKLATEMVSTGPGYMSFALPGQAQIQDVPEQLAIDAEVTEPLGKWKAEEAKIQEPSKETGDLFSNEFAAWEQIVLDHIQDKDAAVSKIKKRGDSFAKAVSKEMVEPAMKAYDNQMNHVKAKHLFSTTAKGFFVTKETAEDRAGKLTALRNRAADVIAGKIFAKGKSTFLGYSQTAMDSVYNLIESELLAGKSQADIAASIRMKFKESYGQEEAYKGQAETIVRTEFGSAISIGQAQFGQDLTTVTKKMRKDWVTMGDNFVRTSHEDAEKSPIDGDSGDVIDARWDNGLRYPRDSDGNAEDVINCRCTIRYVPIEWT